ncbi:fungal-specific transcription factor domain-containing protein [Mycena rebaudengoi]|nr:fungal-specific transcription factor domain-containing protein [Mycena rebaudengoi]
MSDSSSLLELEGTRKRRLAGACDICRRQKIRCDSAKMINNICSNCLSFNSPCTHDSSQKKGRTSRRKRIEIQTPLSSASMADLEPWEDIRSCVDSILSETTPYQAPVERNAVVQLLIQVSRYAKNLEQRLDVFLHSQSPEASDVAHSTKSLPVSINGKAASTDAAANGIILDTRTLPDSLVRLTLRTANDLFSRNIRPVKEALEILNRLPRDIASIPRRPEYWNTYPASPPEVPPSQSFPPDDLLRHLVDIYFTQINIYSLILHRPTFDKSVASGLHLRDHKFGAVLLLVCAVASANSRDPRVIFPKTEEQLSVGLEWFQQVRRPFTEPVMKTASLYDLQLCCLYIMFQQNGSAVVSCYLQSQIGILYAQDMGVHRLKHQTQMQSADNEMAKRCFCFLYASDALISASFGRPRIAITISDSDLPVGCDDEYWEGSDAFQQPPDKPPLAAYIIAYTNLVKIFTLSWRETDTVHSFRGQRLLDRETIEELVSRLNGWTQSIPDHLLWNPYMESRDEAFFNQSCALYTTYYFMVILIHRPYMPTSADRTPTSSSFKALAISTSAARACAHIADVRCRRGAVPSTIIMKAAFDSGITLLLNIYCSKRAGLPIDTAKELREVYKCMTLLRQCERRSQTAGRLYDVLCELMIAAKFDLPEALDESTWDIWTGERTHQEKHDGDAGSDTNVGPGDWPEAFSPLGADDLSGLYGSPLEPEVLDTFPSSLIIPTAPVAPFGADNGAESLPDGSGFELQDGVPAPFMYHDGMSMDVDPSIYALDWIAYLSSGDDAPM